MPLPPSKIPRDLRIRMYDAVMKEYFDKSKKLSISYLVSWLKQHFGKSVNDISRQTLYSLVHGWVKRGVSPYNEAKTPSIKWLKPSPELAYILGALLGDGNWRKRGTKTKISLRVKEYDFALAYARCYDVVEGKRNGEPTQPYYYKKMKVWVVDVTSITLYTLLKPFKIQKIKPFVESNINTIRAFLRGFFDAEGECSNRKSDRRVACSNKNYELIQYVMELLRKIGIESKLRWKKSKTSKGRSTYIWRLYIYGRYIKRYADLVGFVIKKKRDTLQEIINDERYQVRYFMEFLDEILQSKETIVEFLRKFFKYRGCRSKTDRFTRVQFKLAEDAEAISTMLRKIGIDHRIKKIPSNRFIITIATSDVEKLLQNTR